LCYSGNITFASATIFLLLFLSEENRVDIKAQEEDIAFYDQQDNNAPVFASNTLQKQHNIVDLLRTAPSQLPFSARVRKIGLSKCLEQKILAADYCASSPPPAYNRLLESDEKELAGEVLLRRHLFTRCVFENNCFRQATLTIIQNIYLFRHRRIFFGTAADDLGDHERQQALLLFSRSPQETTIPLAKTFQHLILARVWHRIISQASDSFLESRPFLELHDIVEQLNTLRNIYMLLSHGIVGKMTSRINTVYQQSITPEDARQIGSFGIARAAYRYHPSSGLRFSTYASHWILKEIQRQALQGRLIRISANLVEKISNEAQNRPSQHNLAFEQLCRSTTQLSDFPEGLRQTTLPASLDGPVGHLEKQETKALLLDAITKVLSAKSGDIIMRRYGLGQYSGNEQSVIQIAELYGVTRSSIYQIEQTALPRLKKYLLRNTSLLLPPETS
jgi:RNA polymerase sigma factor (sigma-70 family)